MGFIFVFYDKQIVNLILELCIGKNVERRPTTATENHVTYIHDKSHRGDNTLTVSVSVISFTRDHFDLQITENV